MKAALFRGFWTGMVYGVCYFLAELLGTAVVLYWLGTSTGILLVLFWNLVSLFFQYLLFGAVAGIVVIPLVVGVERRLPESWAGPGINFMSLAILYIAVALLWNPESILPGRFYIFLAFGAQLVILLVAGTYLGLDRLTPERLKGLWPLPGSPIPILLGVALLCAGIVGAVNMHQVPARGALNFQGKKPPNVLLLVVDTLLKDRVSAYGYHRETTPNIDRLAAEGALYQEAYTTASWTLPAHASLFTGLYTSTHETDNGRIRLGRSKTTIAEILGQQGYATGGFSANPWLSAMSGLDQGFERFDYLGIQTTLSGFFMNLAKSRFSTLVLGTDQPDLGGREITDALIDWLDGVQGGGQPFFAFANYMEAHEPYGTVPDPYFSKWLPEPLPRTIGRTWVRETPLFLCASCQATGISDPCAGAGELVCKENRWTVPECRLQQVIDLYDAGVTYVDHQIGRIIEALRQRNLLDDTLVIVTSDHGESLGERGQIGHGGLLYNSVLHIPLVIRYPKRFAPGSRITRAVSLVDILPTIESVVGLPMTKLQDALSIVPGPDLEKRENRVLSEYFPIAEKVWKAVGRRVGCDYHLAGRFSASLQKGNEKVIWSSTGEREFYDLAADPGEERNIIEAMTDRSKELERELHQWRKQLKPEHSSAETYEIDPFTKETLEGIGYMQN